MIVFDGKWQDKGMGVKETTGKWIFERFYGPVCEFTIQQYDHNRVGVQPMQVHSEISNSMPDFRLLCLMTKEFLETYPEVAMAIPKIKSICTFKKEEDEGDVEEKLINFIKHASLI